MLLDITRGDGDFCLADTFDEPTHLKTKAATPALEFGRIHQAPSKDSDPDNDGDDSIET